VIGQFTRREDGKDGRPTPNNAKGSESFTEEKWNQGSKGEMNQGQGGRKEIENKEKKSQKVTART